MVLRNSYLPFLFLIFASLITVHCYAQRNCGSKEYSDQMIADNPSFINLRTRIENHTRDFVNTHRGNKTTGVLYTIPVVFHIIYRTNDEIISN